MTLCEGCEINPTNILELIGIDEDKYVEFLIKHGTVKSSVNCPRCGAVCTRKVISFRCHKHIVVDGAPVRCNYAANVKAKSWFHSTRLPLKKVCLFVSVWLTIRHPQHEFIRNVVGMSSQSVGLWSQSCRNICLNSQLMLDYQVIGGGEKIVEVAEVSFGDQICQFDKKSNNSWIFGAFERESKKCFFQIVKNRSDASIKEIIERRIAAGSIIISDLTSKYNRSKTHSDYVFLTVDDSQTNMDSRSEVHIQNVETTWQELILTASSIIKDPKHFDGCVAEFLWKKHYYMNSRFHNFFLEVARQFDPNKL